MLPLAKPEFRGKFHEFFYNLSVKTKDPLLQDLTFTFSEGQQYPLSPELEKANREFENVGFLDLDRPDNTHYRVNYIVGTYFGHRRHLVPEADLSRLEEISTELGNVLGLNREPILRLR
jgi:hypothetical protein